MKDRMDVGARKTLRVRAARLVYGVLLGVLGLELVSRLVTVGSCRNPAAVGVLVALGLCAHFASRDFLTRVGFAFDMTIGLAVVAVAVSGAPAAFVVLIAPDVVHLAHRRRAFWNLGLVANVTAMAAMSLVGAAVWDAVAADGLIMRGLGLAAGGIAMILLNYGLVRLLLVVVRDGASAPALIRRELIGAMPLELIALVTGVGCALLLPTIGIAVLSAFVVLGELPQLVAARLLRAPSVAALTVDDAAAVYRDALADELALCRADRRQVHFIDALVERRPLSEAPPNPLAAMQDALLVTTCTLRPPTQLHFSATPRSQVVLVARAWAQVTARCTPALNHDEALEELERSGLAQDAPLALAAAARIVAREAALTEHIAGVPHLHRAPLPRTVRHELLPVALGRLAA